MEYSPEYWHALASFIIEKYKAGIAPGQLEAVYHQAETFANNQIRHKARIKAAIEKLSSGESNIIAIDFKARRFIG